MIIVIANGKVVVSIDNSHVYGLLYVVNECLDRSFSRTSLNHRDDVILNGYRKGVVLPYGHDVERC